MRQRHPVDRQERRVVAVADDTRRAEGQTLAIVDEVKKALKLNDPDAWPNGSEVSDYAVAQSLGVSRATVSKWRQDKGGMGDATALRAAEITGADPLYYLMRVAGERSESLGVRFVIGKAIKSVEQTGSVLVKRIAVVALAVGAAALGAAPAPSHAAGGAAAQQLYIMSNRRRIGLTPCG